MTNTESYPLTVGKQSLLQSAASELECRSLERPPGVSLTDIQADVLAFVFRSVANERDFEVVLYRLLQLARTFGDEEHSA